MKSNNLQTAQDNLLDAIISNLNYGFKQSKNGLDTEGLSASANVPTKFAEYINRQLQTAGYNVVVDKRDDSFTLLRVSFG